VAMVRNENPHGPLDPARLTAFESRLGVALPADYRQSLLAHNGGELIPDEIVLPGQGEPFSSLGPLFGLHDGPHPLDEVLDNMAGELPRGEDYNPPGADAPGSPPNATESLGMCLSTRPPGRG
jgi:hypothetical protein